MTLLEHTFYYLAPLGRCEASALDQARKIYGIRRMLLVEDKCAIRVEYDSSRLSVEDVEAILRNAAIQLVQNKLN